MWRSVVYCNALLYLVSGSSYVGPKFPSTNGEVWPKPQSEIKTDRYFKFHRKLFEITITKNSCDILQKAVSRTIKNLEDLSEIGKKNRKLLVRKHRAPDSSNWTNEGSRYQGHVRQLQVELNSSCEPWPYYGMDENYCLDFVSGSPVLSSSSIWGILRGLETFVQLFYLTNDYTEVIVNATQICDYPRYVHRGLMLDTARHYISTDNILRTLDAIAMNKMNVFHWHIVDDQSFPYVSETFPELSERGAFYPSMVYTKDEILMIIEYAKDLGIRVIPEIDVPGHTRSWGESYPGMLTRCYDADKKFKGLGPLNPIKNSTYMILKQLIQEVEQLFPDRYFHVGGDEVDLNCWKSNPEIMEYMKQNAIPNVKKLHAMFMGKVIPMLDKTGSEAMVWQEVFDNGVPISKDTLVQVWQYHWTPEMVKITTAGHRVVFSSSWYLDTYLNQNFEKFYEADPRRMVLDATQNKDLAMLVVGGEACMWGEMTDDTNVLTRTWPRASATAEVLWSKHNKLTDIDRRRIEEHTCRMHRRNIPAEPPLGPGFCIE